MLDDAFDDPTDWPADFVHLRQLDQQLRCPICKEYFTTAMVATTCGHTFCSLCVRRCLNQENICPSCRAPLTEGELHPNRLVDNLLRTFRGGRQQLLDALTAEPIKAVPAESDGCKNCRMAGHTGNTDERRKRRRVCTRSMARSGSNGLSGEATAECGIDLTTSDIEEIAASDTDMVPKDDALAGMDDDSDFEPANKMPTAKPSKPPLISDRVPCPTCGQSVRQSQINWHLDRCLAGKSTDPVLFMQGKPTISADQEPTTTAKKTSNSMLKLHSQPLKSMLPRPTKLAYSLLSESKLRRTLKDLGIPSKGDKHQMQARHVEWVNMYMANADSETPVSHKLLLKRLAAWEDTLSRSTEPSKANALVPDTAEEHAAKYADSFADLIAQARANRKRVPVSDPAAADIL